MVSCKHLRLKACLPVPVSKNAIQEIAEHFLDAAIWPEFRGDGPIPGIQSAVFETSVPDILGSRIRVTNLDGSTHVEEIAEWLPGRRLQLQMGNFSGPLSRLATACVETWVFERGGNKTRVARSFELRATSILTMPLLWLISFLLKRAIARHLTKIKHTVKES